MTTCENVYISDPPHQQSTRRLQKKSSRRRIVKKKNKTKFAGVIVERESTLWLESKIDIMSF